MNNDHFPAPVYVPPAFDAEPLDEREPSALLQIVALGLVLALIVTIAAIVAGA